MSPDPVADTLSGIDAAIGAHDALAESMRRNAARFDLFPGFWMPGTVMSESSVRWAPTETATGPGWVSPPGTRYASGPLVDVVADIAAAGDWRHVPTPDPFGGPVPSPSQPGSEPAQSTVSGCHRAPHPLRVWWQALARKVTGRYGSPDFPGRDQNFAENAPISLDSEERS